MTKARQNAAAIERGSNANGEWVRYPDGTQICWIMGVSFTQSTSSRLFYDWTFPIPFIDTEYFVSASAYIDNLSNDGGRGTTVWSDERSNSDCRVSFISASNFSSGDTITGEAYAIGRWK